MTTGIYLLKFNNTDKVYIGQSKNIESRYTSHKTSMRCNKAVKKLQQAYYTYGMPSIHILEICIEEDLDILEDIYIKEFDSVDNGFNTMKNHGYSSSLKGELCGNSKYTNEQIYEVFIYLINGEVHKNISDITGVSRGAVSDISALKTHKWLKDKFPLEYSKLEVLAKTRRYSRRTAVSRNKSYPSIVSPEGTSYTIESIRGFAKEHNLNPNCLGRVLRKQALSHSGWKLK